MKTLPEQIEEHETSQHVLRQLALVHTGPARHAYNMQRLARKASGRVLYLALALLRGVPYNALERTCAVPPSASEIAQLAGVGEEVALGWLEQAACRDAA